MKTLKGQLLIASPELHDPNFFQTVVLMLEHNENGAFGVILNRPSDTMIKEAWDQVRDTPCGSREPLHVGGPCQTPLMAVHTREDLAHGEVLPGVYYAGEPESLEELVTGANGNVRFFVGCAGWGPEQLESELEEGAWNILPAKLKHVFHEEPELWEQVVQEVAGSLVYSALRVKHIPQDPSVN